MAERDNRKWGIDEFLVHDIELVFETTSALLPVLDITLPTWKRIVAGRGVKRNTALKLVKEYFLILRSFGDQDDIPEKTYEKYGLDMLDKYREDILQHRFDKFVKPVPEARKGAGGKAAKP